MPAAGTFDYVAVVPDDANDGIFVCQAESHEDVPLTGSALADERLVGLKLTLAVADAGLTPENDKGLPWVLRARVTLTASSPERATVAQASFYIDRALARRMLPGDVIHLGRTSCAGLGLAIVRSGELVAAVGAVTKVPLGDRVTARAPRDLSDDAEVVFRRRDPEFEFTRLPIEVIVGGRSAILDRGRRTLGDYEIDVIHGFIPGVPGIDESAAIWRKGLCTSVAADASAKLMDQREDGDPLSLVRW